MQSQWWKSALPQLNMRDSWIEVISLSIPCLFMHMQCGMVVDLHQHTGISYRFPPQQWSWAPVKCWCLRLEPGFSPCRIFISEPVIFTLWPLGKKGTVLLPPRQIVLQVEWLKPVLLGVWDRSLFFLHQLLCDLSSYCSSCLWNRIPLFMDWITGNACVCELLIKKTARSNLHISLSYKTQL